MPTKTLSATPWIVAALIAVAVIIIGFVNALILHNLMVGGLEWDDIGNGAQAFLISTLSLLGVITIGVFCIPFIRRLRALEERFREEEGEEDYEEENE